MECVCRACRIQYDDKYAYGIALLSAAKMSGDSNLTP